MEKIANKNTIHNLIKEVYQYFIILISMAGFVPKNVTISRVIAIAFSIIFAIYLGKFQPDNSDLAIWYFLFSEIFYVGFLMIVLSKNGLRLWFIKKWGNENDGYLTYEALLGFLFFHNAISIGYIASSTPDTLFNFIPQDFLAILVAIMFIAGFAIKISAAKIVTIEIYYLKDMFVGRKISDFVETGPYKYLSNPMYGIGQLQAYATAIWYGSKYGLIAAILNQVLVFSFFYLVEKKFIKRTYQKSII